MWSVVEIFDSKFHSFDQSFSIIDFHFIQVIVFDELVVLIQPTSLNNEPSRVQSHDQFVFRNSQIKKIYFQDHHPLSRLKDSEQ